jgi:hypothetical protein
MTPSSAGCKGVVDSGGRDESIVIFLAKDIGYVENSPLS